jgi:PKHD-type hydroxylase
MAQQIVMNALAANPLVQAFALPKFILPPIISQYTPGMNYGWHTDSPIMGDTHPVRIDMSMTLFLSDPASYTGGELIIHTPTGYVNFKLNKGDAIIYPTTRLHCVNPVTEGVRLAAVTWIQSFIKDTEKRELVMLIKTIQEMIAASNINSTENLMLLQVYSNLVRMWTEI